MFHVLTHQMHLLVLRWALLLPHIYREGNWGTGISHKGTQITPQWSGGAGPEPSWVGGGGGALASALLTTLLLCLRAPPPSLSESAHVFLSFWLLTFSRSSNWDFLGCSDWISLVLESSQVGRIPRSPPPILDGGLLSVTLLPAFHWDNHLSP